MSKKVNDPSTAPKPYWSILNWFPNNKKISSNFPIFYNGKVTSDFKEKTNQFNSCTPVSSFSVLLDISFRTNTRLNSFSIAEKHALSYN